MTYDTKEIARAVHLSEAAIRQWICRSPDLSIGRIEGHARVFSAVDAMTLIIAAELLRYRLARPHKAFPAAKAIAKRASDDTVWVHRGPNDDLVITETQPAAAVAVALPLGFLRARLSSVATQPKGLKC